MTRREPVVLARHYTDLAREVAHITAMVRCLEQMISDQSADHRATLVTQPEYWRARLGSHVHVPPALRPQVQRLLARLDAIRHSASGSLTA